MNRFHCTLILDKDMLHKVENYYIYRSQEEERGRPIIDGVYVQRETIDINPPENIDISLQWG